MTMIVAGEMVDVLSEVVARGSFACEVVAGGSFASRGGEHGVHADLDLLGLAAGRNREQIPVGTMVNH